MRKFFALLAFFAVGVVLDDAYPAERNTAIPGYAELVQGQERDYGRTCLALAAYSEARGEGDAGMLAVMRVVLNRARDERGRWPATICDVTAQPGQFQGVDGWPFPRVPRESSLWARALSLTDDALAGRGLPAGCAHAMFFHRIDANLQPLASGCRIGNHIFY